MVQDHGGQCSDLGFYPERDGKSLENLSRVSPTMLLYDITIILIFKCGNYDSGKLNDLASE